MDLQTRGFTLIELLTTIAILMIVIALLFAQTRPLQDTAKLDETAENVASALRLARQYALTVREHRGQYPSYGVHFDTNNDQEVLIYADCIADDNGDGSLTISDTYVYTPTQSNCGGPPGPVEKVQLGYGHRITSITSTAPNTIGCGGFPVCGLATTTQTEVSVLFVRPDPTIWFTNNLNLPSNAPDQNLGYINVGYITIRIENASGSDYRTVYFNSTGLIDIGP